MLRFYSPADTRKSLPDLYRIESVKDYIASIGKLSIDIDAIKKTRSLHPDYEFTGKYLIDLIEDVTGYVFSEFMIFQRKRILSIDIQIRNL
ncbi:hypothetical protein [Desulfobacula sp.]|uniref:hypothetical protein n=1 Tax=Desulfobacula sp. TaxID=2593537 RepID=UPI001EC5FB6D|nr:hypothetical protein [Desulfobacula sp.]